MAPGRAARARIPAPILSAGSPTFAPSPTYARTRLVSACLLIGRLGCVPEAVAPYRVHDRCAERFRIGRVLLAGDAAHLVNPIGGLGLTGGLLDAVSLGDALIAVIAGRRRDDILDAWAHERRRVHLEVTAPTAQENRRRVGERDPEKRRLDAERLQRLTLDPEAAREALLRVFAIVGRVQAGASDPVLDTLTS